MYAKANERLIIGLVGSRAYARRKYAAHLVLAVDYNMMILVSLIKTPHTDCI